MKIRIGTRGSKLALAQTELMKQAISEKYPDVECETVIITTKGDKIQNRPLSEIGGAGVFAGEIENALRSGSIDIAVHSAKDLPVLLDKDFEIRCVLKRGNPSDALICRHESRPENGRLFRIGTGSLRRRSAHAKLYPELNAEYSDIRGNVDTRLQKLMNGEYDGIILAAAGLERLGLTPLPNSMEISFFDAEKFLPAPCQAIIAAESRRGEFAEILDSVNDYETFICFCAERCLLEFIGGDCSKPLGALAYIKQGVLYINAAADGVTVKTVSGEPLQYRLLAERLVKML